MPEYVITYRFRGPVEGPRPRFGRPAGGSALVGWNLYRCDAPLYPVAVGRSHWWDVYTITRRYMRRGV